MSLYEFECCYQAWRQINERADDKPPVMSDEKLRELGIEGF